MTAVYECWNAAGSSGGKKDDKWYYHGKIEINTERMNEEQAVKKMEEGKDIMTLNKNLAMDVLTRFKDAGKGWGHLKVEAAHQKTDGYYDHLHYGRNGVEERLHCWIWKKV